MFGSQCIVISVEAKCVAKNKWEAYTDGGRERTSIDAIEWIKRAIDLGVGEILITSIDQDGTKNGYELDLIGAITEFSPIPVIAHGGAGTIESIEKVIRDTKVDAVSASSIFHYKDFSISEIKKYLSHHAINVRI